MLLALVLAGLLAAGTWILIGQVASYPRVLNAVQRADMWWLIPALAGTVLGYLGYALLYIEFAAAEGGPRPPLGLTLRLAVAIFGTSVIATSAGRLGSEYWSLRRMGEAPGRASSRVLALNTAEWAVLAALAAAGAVALLLGVGRSAPLGVELAWLLVPPGCALVAMLVSSPSRRRPLGARAGRVRRLWVSVIGSLTLIRWVGHRGRPRRLAGAGALIYWGGELLIAWAALRAFGIEIGPASLAVAYATGYISTTLPLPAGGAGGVDAASIYALTLIGVPLHAALLATLVQRVFSYWLPILIAILSAGSLRHLGRRLGTVSRPAPA